MKVSVENSHKEGAVRQQNLSILLVISTAVLCLWGAETG
jgi:hypothetical protein